MATQTYPPSGGNGPVGLSQAGNGTSTAPRGDFIPQLWSDEIMATYKRNLILAPTISNLSHSGKKGDAITIPSPGRGSAYAKAAGTAVTLQYANEASMNILIDKHYEYSRLIEDIVGVQALPSLRAFYVDDAGYQLATRVDQHIALLWHYFNAGNTTPSNANLFEKAVSGADGSTVFSGAADTTTSGALTDAAIRKMIQTLDDNDVPQSERVLVIPPVEKKNLLGLSRFTEQAFVGEMGAANSIRNGMIGDVYGVPIYVTTNCPCLHVQQTADTQVVNFSTTVLTGAAETGDISQYTIAAVDFSSVNSTVYRVGALYHKSALVLVEQMAIRSQVQYKQEYLADLLTSDTIYGTGRLRDGGSGTNSLPTAGLAFVVPA